MDMYPQEEDLNTTLQSDPIVEVYTSISFADKICYASTNETSSYQRIPSLPTTYWYNLCSYIPKETIGL